MVDLDEIDTETHNQLMLIDSLNNEAAHSLQVYSSKAVPTIEKHIKYL